MNLKPIYDACNYGITDAFPGQVTQLVIVAEVKLDAGGKKVAMFSSDEKGKALASWQVDGLLLGPLVKSSSASNPGKT